MTCSTEGCERPVYNKSRRLCSACYQREWHAANPNAAERYKAKRRKPQDRPCTRCKIEIVRRPKRWCETCRETNRRARQLAQYGLTIADYEALLSAQDGTCAICCGVPSDALVVDHDHKTGKVRGLLCRGCNVGIGNLGDDVGRLRTAIAYLEG